MNETNLCEKQTVRNAFSRIRSVFVFAALLCLMALSCLLTIAGKQKHNRYCRDLRGWWWLFVSCIILPSSHSKAGSKQKRGFQVKEMLRKQMVIDCVLKYIRIFYSSFFTSFKVPAELDYSILPATHSETRTKKGDGASPHYCQIILAETV